MPREGHHGDRPQFEPQDEVDEVLGRANPNPERVGCPPDDALGALARRQRPIGDPAYEHLAECSPCYREFRRLQQAQRRRLSQRLLAAAAAIAIVLTGAWYFLRMPQAPPGIKDVATQTDSQREVRAELDLRRHTVSRSDEKGPERPRLSLTRGRLQATILLPVGSEPGRYEIQVLDEALQSRLTAVGTAEFRNKITTLQTVLDLRSLPSGLYHLALRHEGEDWRLFPASID